MVERFNNILAESILLILQKGCQRTKWLRKMERGTGLHGHPRDGDEPGHAGTPASSSAAARTGKTLPPSKVFSSAQENYLCALHTSLLLLILLLGAVLPGSTLVGLNHSGRNNELSDKLSWVIHLVCTTFQGITSETLGAWIVTRAHPTIPGCNGTGLVPLVSMAVAWWCLHLSMGT
ncbi:hypothetical protein DV515_00003979, partial [Chloebia gouldiae]